MKVVDLINYLAKYNENTDIQMRDCDGDWTTDIDVKNIGLFVYICGQLNDNVCDSLKELARREFLQ